MKGSHQPGPTANSDRTSPTDRLIDTDLYDMAGDKVLPTFISKKTTNLKQLQQIFRDEHPYS